MANKSIMDSILSEMNLYGDSPVSPMRPLAPAKQKPRSPMSNAPLQSQEPKKDLLEMLNISNTKSPYEGGQSSDPLMMLLQKPQMPPERMSKQPVYQGGQSNDVLQQLLKKPEAPQAMMSSGQPPEDNYVMAQRPPQKMTPAEQLVLGGNTFEEMRQQYVKDHTGGPMNVTPDEPKLATEPQRTNTKKLLQNPTNTGLSQNVNYSTPVSTDGNPIQGAIEDFNYNMPEMGSERDRLDELENERQVYANYLSNISASDREDLTSKIDFANAMNRTGKKIGQNYRAPTSGVVESDKLSGFGDRIEKVDNERADRQIKIDNAINENQIKREKMLSDERIGYALANQKSGDSLSDNMFNYAIAKYGTDNKKFAARAGKNSSGKIMTSGDVQKISEADQGLEMLDRLKLDMSKNRQQIGPITGLKSLLPWSDSKQMLALVALSKQSLGKGMEGGVLRAEDEKKYAKIIPTMTDTYETIVKKLKEIEQTLRVKKSTTLNNLKKGGYNTDGFQQEMQALENGNPIGVNVSNKRTPPVHLVEAAMLPQNRNKQWAKDILKLNGTN